MSDKNSKKDSIDTGLSTFRRALKFRNVVMDLLADREFYDSVERYQSDDELLKIAKAILPENWPIQRDRIFYFAKPPTCILPNQGWKIHISATFSNAQAVLKATISVCVTLDAPFKFTCDQRLFTLINSRQWNRGASGKFITIYPRDEEHFKKLLKALYTELMQFEGPYILSDRRYKDCKVLYYRYGGITSGEWRDYDGSYLHMLTAPDGQLIPDVRQPFFSLPPWVTDPFPTEEKISGEPVLKNGRYTVTKSLAFSNNGGVYLALDNETGQTVVIKEARPHTESSANGNDAITLREKEWRILNKLKDTGLVAQPIDLFWDWEHLFLVESYVRGVTVQSFPAIYSPLIYVDPTEDQVRQCFERIIAVGKNIAMALEVLRDHGIVFGDLSPNNIIVDQDTFNITLIDLEGAYEVGTDDSAFLFTTGFTTMDRLSRSKLRYADDYYSLGAILFWLIHGVITLSDLEPNAHKIFLEEIQQDFCLPDELIQTILSLLDTVEENRPRPDQVVKILEGIKVLPRISTPKLVPESQIKKTLDGISRHIRSVTTPDRNDRLFPADPSNVNPLNVSYGALGVAYVLKKLDGKVPEEVMDWILRQNPETDKYPAGFFVGLSGVAWAFSELGFHDRGVDALDKASRHRHLLKTPDLFYGAAGFGLTNLYFWERTREQRFLDEATRVCEWLLETKREDKRGYSWPSPDGSSFIGYGQGASGIALFLLYLYKATGESNILSAASRALEFDLSFGVQIENMISFPDDSSGSKVVYPYWIRGSAGVCTTLLRYVTVTGDERFKGMLRNIAIDTFRKYTIFPGLFQGVSGLGNFLLDCYQFTKEELYLQQAYRVANGVKLFTIQRPTGIAFPGDNLYRLSTDLATGSAGVGFFLHRLLHGKPNFSFMPDGLLKG
ncbi:class III lanthionine synthetase LanKC [Bacillus safensis]|uniref:class III lanthionine synthetase LanKC n=1 Tax=Bacillus safensis TaxID=561879 RepID=UPI0004162B84|nr:class III lanthionine synthetase LanKC [Bacillus safensis]